MPFDVLLLSVAVTAVFVGFGVVLAWVDHWSRQPQAEASARSREMSARGR